MHKESVKLLKNSLTAKISNVGSIHFVTWRIGLSLRKKIFAYRHK